MATGRADVRIFRTALSCTKNGAFAERMADVLASIGDDSLPQTSAPLSERWVLDRALYGPEDLGHWVVLQELNEDVQIQLAEANLPHRVLVSFVKQGRLCDRAKAIISDKYCSDPEVIEWLENSLADRVAAMAGEDDRRSVEEIVLEVREQERVSWWKTLRSAESYVSKEEAAPNLLYYFYDEYSGNSSDKEEVASCVDMVLATFSRKDIVDITREFLQKLYCKSGRKVGMELAGIFDRISKEDAASVAPLDTPASFFGEPLHIFTSELLDYLIAGPKWQLAFSHALNDEQYARVLDLLKQESRWYMIPVPSSRAQALVCMDTIETTFGGAPASATMAGMHLARWVTGPNDPLLRRCLAVTNPQALRFYGLGLWRTVSGEVLLPADAEEAIEKYEIKTMAKAIILEVLGKAEFIDWHYQIVRRISNGPKMLAFADPKLGRFLWENFEAECGDSIASALNLLLSGRGRLCDVARTVRILETAV